MLRERFSKPGEQRCQNREAVLRGLFERAVLAREFRSSREILTARVRTTVREKRSRSILTTLRF